jgi:enolase
VKIERVRAIEILDSRGNPTVQAQVKLANGTVASAQVPSGASTGSHEALELRDGDARRYAGKGVRKAVENVNEILGPAVAGLDAADQQTVDRRLIEVDGSEGKRRLGANAVLAVSCAVARAGAAAPQIPLWRHLASGRPTSIPVPMVNIISGGLHAGGNIEFQDFLVIPSGYPDFASALEAVVSVHRATGQLLRERGFTLTGVADEGGWGPKLRSNEAGAALLREAIERAGATMDIALDVASTHFFEGGVYRFEGRTFNSRQMAEALEGWVSRYGITSIEDACAEDDWEGWRWITARLGDRVQLVGDDLFVTEISRLNRGIEERAANAVLVKMNQIGTITETFTVIDRAREAGYGAVISARSGETEDSFLADLAVASGAGQIKVGSVTRSERLAKYNRLLEIENSDRESSAGD